MDVIKAHHHPMTTATCIREIEEQPLRTENTPSRSGGTASSPLESVLRSLRGFWRDQVYLHERLLAAQRPGDDASNLR
jgi:hypothetical protein